MGRVMGSEKLVGKGKLLGNDQSGRDFPLSSYKVSIHKKTQLGFLYGRIQILAKCFVVMRAKMCKHFPSP